MPTPNRIDQYMVSADVLADPRRLIGHVNLHGLALVEGAGADAFFDAFRRIARPLDHRDSDTDAVTRLTFRPEVADVAGFAGFSREAMPPHTDGSAQSRPPTLLANICVSAPEWGGSALLADGKRVLARLAAESPLAFAKLCQAGSARFGNAIDARSVFDRDSEGRTFVRYRDDGQLAAPGLEDAIATLRDLIREEQLVVDLGVGSGYILQNGRWLHGRTRFEGSREVLRMLGGPRTVLGASIEYGFDLDSPNAAAN